MKGNKLHCPEKHTLTENNIKFIENESILLKFLYISSIFIFI